MANIFEKFKQEVTEENNYDILNELTSTKYPGNNLAWLKECTLEQLKSGISLILSNLSYDEFKTQILNK